MEKDTVLEMQALIKEYGTAGQFKPFAYYDKHLDCIRVQFFDCSFTEERLNQFLTVLKANHDESERAAGFNIKGVRFLFEKMGLGVSGVHKLTSIIDKLASIYPDAVFEQIKRQFSPLLREEGLEVALS